MTHYITLGLITKTGAPVGADGTYRAVLFVAAAVAGAGATIYTKAKGEGMDELGAREPCIIWAIGGLTTEQAHAVAEGLATLCNQRCVTVTAGTPVFVEALCV